MYKSAKANEKVHKQTTGGNDQFGAAHYAGQGNLVPLAYVTTAAAASAPPSAPPSGKTQGEALKEYFNALTVAASTNQNLLAELIESVSKLTKTNAKLVQSIAQLTKANKSLSA